MPSDHPTVLSAVALLAAVLDHFQKLKVPSP
jgi:hypothetical protein